MSAAAVVALTGCDGGNEPEASTSVPSSPLTSPSESVDDAAAEAQVVYENYMAALPAFYAAESPDYTTLLEWATDEVATNEAAAANDLAANGIRLEGVPAVLATIVAPGATVTPTEIELGICSDVSATRFVDASGTDVTPTDRPNPSALAVSFERLEASGPWLISSMGPWTEDSQPCP